MLTLSERDIYRVIENYCKHYNVHFANIVHDAHYHSLKYIHKRIHI